MRLGLNLGYWGAGNDAEQPRAGPRGRRPRLRRGLGRGGLRLGCRRPSCSWVAAQTDTHRRRLRDLPDPRPHPGHDRDDRGDASTPCSGGRFRLGLGVSGPQVSEGWHGVRFDKPLARTREYVDIVSHGAAPARRSRYDGEFFTLPLPDGPGKALEAHRAPGARGHPDLPGGGRSQEPRADRRDRRRLARDLLLARVRRGVEHLAHIAAGPRQGRRRTIDGIRRRAHGPGGRRRRRRGVRRAVRAYRALYIGGHGQPRAELLQPARRPHGLRAEAAEVQEQYLARDTTAAAAAVPFELIDRTSLHRSARADRGPAAGVCATPGSPR